MTKTFIFNADDFGMTKEYNRAVLEGYNNGCLTSASICANGNAFLGAINDIIPECSDLGIGVHLNIIEGKALTNCPLLTDKNGYFNKGYLYFILNSYNKNFLTQVEQEFKAQIKKITDCASVDHIDSHVHTHAIPNIFKLVCKLATEYKIPYVRTQFEKFYVVPKINKHLTISYPINLIKIALLNFFTLINRKTLKSYNLITNDYLIGVGYTAMMDSDTVSYGLKAIDTDSIVEALIHPCCYNNLNLVDSHSIEFKTTLDKNLKASITRMGYELKSHKEIV